MPRKRKDKTQPEKQPNYRRVHFLIREDLYEALWKITVEKYPFPAKKLHVVINEALQQYVKNYTIAKGEGETAHAQKEGA